jgi:biotin transport system substrate-specific component
VSSLSLPRPVLADAIPGGRVRDALLVGGGTLFVAATAQIAIPLGFTPVPLSLQTFGVLLIAASFGPARAGASLAIYMVIGMAGAPWFAEQNSGWQFASFGYIVGFLLAAVLVGALARRGADRTVVRSVGLMVVGNLAIYAVGVPGLMLFAGVDLATALTLGVLPFLLGDAIKIVFAAGLLPAAWKLVGEDRAAR